ncbi:MAG: TorD/DmsD family molecular chaperone [Burkholderiales bacterium]
MSDAVSAAGESRTLPPNLLPEDQARADFYALLAALYASGPDRGLLASIARAPDLGLPTFIDRGPAKSLELAAAWDALRAASAVMPAEAAEQEYVDLFVGVGKSEVNLHGSHWLTGFMMDRPLAEVRQTLATLGLQRKPEADLVEDHVSALCETMRLLIAGGTGFAPVDAATQQRFFAAHIEPWIERCTAAIGAHAIANYYRRVAQFTECFMALERESLVID